MHVYVSILESGLQFGDRVGEGFRRPMCMKIETLIVKFYLIFVIQELCTEST